MRVATFDIETNGFLEELDTIWCAVVIDHATGNCESFSPGDIDRLPATLDSYDVLIGHNSIAFDFPALRKVLGYEYRGIKVDTLLMSRMQRPKRRAPKGVQAGPHSVDAWSVRLNGADGRKVEHNEWDRFSPEMLHRCRRDAEIQVQIYHALLREGQGEGWKNAHKLNFTLFENLQRQEEYGWLVDRAHIDHCVSTLERWIDRIDRAVGPHLPLRVVVGETKKDGEYNYVRKPFKKDGSYSKVAENFIGNISLSDLDVHDDRSSSGDRLVGGQFSRVSFRPTDLDSNKETKEFLIDEGWVPAEWNTNNVGDRTSPKLSKDDPFEGLTGGLGKLVAKRVQCRHRLSNIRGYVELIRSDGRIPAKVTGMASTGRMRHTNIVNVPSPHSNAFFAKQMRQIFIAKPGWVMVGVDSKGNQIRQLAARMGDDEFTEAVLHGTQEDGTDLHSLNQKRSGAPSRSRAKNFFYGFIFGAGDAKIGKVVDGTAEDGRRLREDYLNGLPKLRELLDRLTLEWQKTAKRWWNKKWNRMEYRDGWIRGLDGRPILVDSEHKLLCFTLQSDEAIQMAAAYNVFHKWMERDGYVYGQDWGMLIWMHDEFQFECRPDIADHAAALGCEAIAWAGRYYNIACPHEGDAQIGVNWYETH